MTKQDIAALTLAASILGAGAAMAQDVYSPLKPLHAYTFQLNDETAVLYYRPVGSQFEVVATVASAESEATRFVTRLDSGASAEIVTSGSAVGADTAAVRVVRKGRAVSARLVRTTPVLASR